MPPYNPIWWYRQFDNSYVEQISPSYITFLKAKPSPSSDNPSFLQNQSKANPLRLLLRRLPNPSIACCGGGGDGEVSAIQAGEAAADVAPGDSGALLRQEGGRQARGAGRCPCCSPAPGPRPPAVPGCRQLPRR